LKEVGKPDNMAGLHILSIMRIFQNKYKNSVKTAEIGTVFALSLSLSLSLYTNV
jgi:hypothetical protein